MTKNINNGTMATASGSCWRTTVAPQSFWQTESFPGSCLVHHLTTYSTCRYHTTTLSL